MKTRQNQSRLRFDLGLGRQEITADNLNAASLSLADTWIGHLEKGNPHLRRQEPASLFAVEESPFRTRGRLCGLTSEKQ